jgi:hypothetical protein
VTRKDFVLDATRVSSVRLCRELLTLVHGQRSTALVLDLVRYLEKRSLEQAQFGDVVHAPRSGTRLAG